MTGVMPIINELVPERVKRRLRRPVTALAPLILLRSAAYHLGWHRLNRICLEGLHLGCGDLRIPGFVNIDGAAGCDCDVVARVDRLKFADNTVSTIYSAHVFEHFDRAQSPGVLREWCRVLKPGGRLYLACPDMESLSRLYLQHVAYDHDDSRRIIDTLTGVFYGGQCHRYNYHYNGWSFPRLKANLEKAGFTNVRRFDTNSLMTWRPFVDASFATVADKLVSLNVQADKPDESDIAAGCRANRK